jgi:multiple RNA-binding domain-containing protein 1
MSRLIVKNLPSSITEQKIRDLFGQKGEITDVQLKHKDGKFRKFGFIGYQNSENGSEAVKFFNNTFIGASKISVELCAVLGDASKPKSWSKYAKDSEIYKKKNEKKHETEIVVQEETETKVDSTNDKKSKNATKIEAIIGERKNDPMFQEFMKSHAKDKLAWENDVGVGKEEEEKEKLESTKSTESHENVDEKLANKEISDKDYMKQLMGGEATNSKPSKMKYEKADKKSKEDMVKLFTIKIRNLPNKVKREDIIKFFRPSKAHSVRIPRTAGFAYVGFKLERDMQVSFRELVQSKKI